ncbi:hypothetical protein K504DRAFT_538166 [Pleomassaria siparia CBS 279.74]|uniref:Uncharacterized protein n=1 Tax=Pleomassaria siparia CBS 279.74 TaxID=1314801 RepID=A0A6G1JVH7_9PLEO|nr:hypothetical protein K504DRAFT_538166 [Pleomassaria siparia CBS 279.74]
MGLERVGTATSAMVRRSEVIFQSRGIAVMGIMQRFAMSKYSKRKRPAKSKNGEATACIFKSSQARLFVVAPQMNNTESQESEQLLLRDCTGFWSYSSLVTHVVDDILSLVKVLSEPANHAPLKAERALATDWYRQRQDADTEPRPAALPDSPQPPFARWNDPWKPTMQPELPRNDTPREFPFTSTCLVSALLRGSKSTRTGDVQLQPLSTPFYSDCLEYGMVVVNISNLEHVKYGIVAFPVCYMAQVDYYNEYGGWDPVEDDPPKKEPDIVLVDERPRVPLSILGYLRKYFSFMENDPKVLELQACALVDDPSVLDYIWPSYSQTPIEVEHLSPRWASIRIPGFAQIWIFITGYIIITVAVCIHAKAFG